MLHFILSLFPFEIFLFGQRSQMHNDPPPSYTSINRVNFQVVLQI